MTIYSLIVLLRSVATGCMSSPRIDDLSGAERAKAANMPVHNDNPYPPAKVINTVTGLSCNRNGHQQQDVSQ